MDIDYDGGVVNLYTPIEIEELKAAERKRVIYMIQNIERITFDYGSDE